MSEESAFKNFINPEVVKLISKEIKSVHPSFPKTKFDQVSANLSPLELKARVLLITKSLREHLPQDYKMSLGILIKVMKRGNLQGFKLWPFSEYIGQYGLDHFDESLKAIYVLTQHFTGEWAVRPFLIKNPVRALKFLSKCALDKNHHVRRWVSEGTRPLLPWGERLPRFIMDPSETLILLEKLKFDEELYVRKSVANHLNDISKNHPLVVIQILKLWQRDCSATHQEKLNWIKKQALRTLIKKGHPDALKLMGVSGEAKVNLTNFKISKPKYCVGETLAFTFDLKSVDKKKQKLVIDYQIAFLRANGSHGAKVFKLKTIELNPKESLTLSKNHSLKSITTKTYYPGVHHLKIQINGVVLAGVEWFFST